MEQDNILSISSDINNCTVVKLEALTGTEKKLSVFTWERRTSLYVPISLNAIVNLVMTGPEETNRDFISKASKFRTSLLNWPSRN